MNIQENNKPKKIKIVIIIVGIVIISIVNLIIGMAIGFYEARFSYTWGENYMQNFVDPPTGSPHMGPPSMGPPPPGQNGQNWFPPDMRGLQNQDFRNPHGLSGTIISILDNTLVIKDEFEKENSVAITDKTLIKRGQDTITISDLKEGDQVVVLGDPSDKGVVNADLIRVFESNGQ